MTSFLALRASVVRICCVYSPGNVLRVWVAGRTLPLDHFIYSAYFGRRPLDGRLASGSNRQIDPYNNFSTPERAQFCSDAPPNSKSCPHA